MRVSTQTPYTENNTHNTSEPPKVTLICDIERNELDYLVIEYHNYSTTTTYVRDLFATTCDYGADVSIGSAFLSRSAIIPTTFPGEEHAVHASRVHTMADRHTSADHQAHTRASCRSGSRMAYLRADPNRWSTLQQVACVDGSSMVW